MDTRIPNNAIFCCDKKITNCVNNPNLFRDKYPISYRLVILHAVWSYIKNSSTGDKISLLIVLDKINDVISGKNINGFYEPGLLEFYCFKKNEDIGFVLIDRSKGCYPLIFYPKDDTKIEHKKDRIDGLTRAIDYDLMKNHDKYQKILKDIKSWDEASVNKLRENFMYESIG